MAALPSFKLNDQHVISLKHLWSLGNAHVHGYVLISSPSDGSAGYGLALLTPFQTHHLSCYYKLAGNHFYTRSYTFTLVGNSYSLTYYVSCMFLKTASADFPRLYGYLK